MLALSSIHTLLSQILSLPDLHTAILCTPCGQLVSYTSDPDRAKDDIFVVVGLGGEAWQENKGQGVSQVDSELGRIVVIPIEPASEQRTNLSSEVKAGPLMLLILNSTEMIGWDELQTKGQVLAEHLQKPLGRFRDFITPAQPPTGSSVSPKGALRMVTANR